MDRGKRGTNQDFETFGLAKQSKVEVKSKSKSKQSADSLKEKEQSVPFSVVLIVDDDEE